MNKICMLLQNEFKAVILCKNKTDEEYSTPWIVANNLNFMLSGVLSLDCILVSEVVRSAAVPDELPWLGK